MLQDRDRAPARQTLSHGTARAIQWALTGLLLLTLLLNGAADLDTRPPLMLAASLILAFTLALPIQERGTQHLIRRILFLTLGLGAWALLQAWPLPLWLPVHAIWRDLAETFNTGYGHISVNPDATRRALPGLILPFLVFVGSVLVTQSESLARKFWKKLSIVGFLVVLVSVIRQVFFPESLIFSGEPLRSGQFSGVFINRNVAASAFGLAGFALLGSLAIHLAEDASLSAQRRQTDHVSKFWTYVFLACALFLTVLCLILTRSRAGSLGSLIILLPCLFLVLRHGAQHRLPKFLSGRLAGASLLMGLTCLIVLLAAYGEPVLSRVETTNDQARWCTWASTLDAIKTNTFLGTGFATFQDIFPTYRNPTCDRASIAWHRAHNSFLEFYLGMGLPGLILLGSISAICMQKIIHGLKVRRRMKSVLIALIGAVLFVAVHSMVDFPLQIPGIAMYFSALLGVGVSFCLTNSGRHAKRRRSDVKSGQKVTRAPNVMPEP